MGHYVKMIGLVVAMVAGATVPQAASFAWLVQYLIMFMLFFACLDIELGGGICDKSIAILLAANLGIATAVYLAVFPLYPRLAQAAFMTAISPTATAAPVVVGFLGGEVEYVVVAVLVTNGCVALILPLFLSLQGGGQATAIWGSLQSVLAVILLPLILAQALRRLAPQLAALVKRASFLAFDAWLAALLLACASASHFIRRSVGNSLPQLAGIAAISLAICALNFSVGYLLGRPKYGREASQALGQKNTMLTVWFSLAFFSPFVALGPTFYVIYHNLYNAFQLLQRGKSGRACISPTE